MAVLNNMNKHTPDIEGIVEEFNNKFPHFVHYYERHTSGEHKLIDAKDWLRTTLQSQADKYEREKRDMVIEILSTTNVDTQTIYAEGVVDDIRTNIKTVAQRHGIDLSE